MGPRFGYLIVLITIIANLLTVHGDCEMDCTDTQVQQNYGSVANTENSRPNSGINFYYIFCLSLQL